MLKDEIVNSEDYKELDRTCTSEQWEAFNRILDRLLSAIDKGDKE